MFTGILITFLAAAILFFLLHTANLKYIRWIRKDKITYERLISQAVFVAIFKPLFLALSHAGARMLTLGFCHLFWSPSNQLSGSCFVGGE